MADKKQSDIKSLTALFTAKNGGRVGSINGEYLSRLIKIIASSVKKAGGDFEKAKKAALALISVTEPCGAEVVFFVRTWKQGENPRLSSGPGTPRKKSSKRDDFDSDFGGEPEDDGFGGGEDAGIDFD